MDALSFREVGVWQVKDALGAGQLRLDVTRWRAHASGQDAWMRRACPGFDPGFPRA